MHSSNPDLNLRLAVSFDALGKAFVCAFSVAFLGTLFVVLFMHFFTKV